MWRWDKIDECPCAFPSDPDGLRQNCRTAHGEFAYMGLQAGENASSAGLNGRAQGLDIGAAIPLRGEQPFLRARARRKGYSPRSGIAPPMSSPCARALSPAEGAFSPACGPMSSELSVGCSTSVEGHLDREAMRRGHSSILPHRHIRQHLRLHETAPRRGQRHLQVSARVHGLSRRRSVLSARSTPEASAKSKEGRTLQCACPAPALPARGFVGYILFMITPSEWDRVRLRAR